MDVNDDNDAILTKALSGLSYELKVSVTINADIFLSCLSFWRETCRISSEDLEE